MLVKPHNDKKHPLETTETKRETTQSSMYKKQKNVHSDLTDPKDLIFL